VVVRLKELKLRGKGFILKKVLRALGKGIGLESPFPSEEERTSNVSPFQSHYAHKQFRNTMLEAERHRAKGLENRRHNLVC